MKLYFFLLFLPGFLLAGFLLPAALAGRTFLATGFFFGEAFCGLDGFAGALGAAAGAAGFAAKPGLAAPGFVDTGGATGGVGSAFPVPC